MPEVEIGAVHELVGNALIMKGEKRETDLRGEPLINGGNSDGKEGSKDA